jgi:Sulfotransferase family
MQSTIQEREEISFRTQHDSIPVSALVSALVSAESTRLSGLGRSRTKHLLKDLLSRARRNCVRELWDWYWCKQAKLPTASELARSLELFDIEKRSYELDEESPIFLLSTGWRSGSTLLQRIIVTDPNVLLWGEPFGDSAIFSQMAKMLCGLANSPDIKLARQPNDRRLAALSTSWIATLYPAAPEFRQALQSFLFAWLGQSAQRRGFGRWGFKEVRLGATEAMLLHWIFPKAKFVFLSRNPFDCYRSLADSGWHHMYFQRPDIRVDSAAGIAKHWNRVAVSWAELPKTFPMFRVKYEDVVDGNFNFRELESWLGIKLREDVALSACVGSTARRAAIGHVERWIIAREARAGIRALGYS